MVEERASGAVQAALEEDQAMLVWWSTDLECVSAIARREREGKPSRETVEALDRLRALASGWHEVEPAEVVRSTARRLLRVHPLRAADALQLAAAVETSRGGIGSLPFVSLDERLVDAARREGFTVLVPEAQAP